MSTVLAESAALHLRKQRNSTNDYWVAPSILSADFTRLGEEVGTVLEAGADTFVAGSAILGAGDYAWVIARMRDRLADVH